MEWEGIGVLRSCEEEFLSFAVGKLNEGDSRQNMNYKITTTWLVENVLWWGDDTGLSHTVNNGEGRARRRPSHTHDTRQRWTTQKYELIETRKHLCTGEVWTLDDARTRVQHGPCGATLGYQVLRRLYGEKRRRLVTMKVGYMSGMNDFDSWPVQHLWKVNLVMYI